MKKSILAALAVVLLIPAIAGARGEYTIDPIDPIDPGPTPQETCSELFTNRLDVRCCIKHVLAGEKPEACPELPPPPETQPVEPQPEDDACSSIDDPILKGCCEQHEGLTLEAVAECIPDSDDPTEACNIIVNVTGDVNGQMNVCCHYVNNANVLQETDILQECRNVFEGPSPEVPTDQATPAVQPSSFEQTSPLDEESGLEAANIQGGGCSLAAGTSEKAYSTGFISLASASALLLIIRSSRRSSV